MIQYKVPQDVQREDTIIGPVTIKQLIILGVGGAIAYALYVSLAKTYFIEIWLPPVGVISAITLAFAFLKINGLEFHIFLMNFIEYHLLPRKRVWIQGAGYPLFSQFNESKKNKKAEAPKEQNKQQKSFEELSSILDSYGNAEINRAEKKAALNEIIQQNYKNQ